jgi:hypothetical protein
VHTAIFCGSDPGSLKTETDPGFVENPDLEQGSLRQKREKFTEKLFYFMLYESTPILNPVKNDVSALQRALQTKNFRFFENHFPLPILHLPASHGQLKMQEK